MDLEVTAELAPVLDGLEAAVTKQIPFAASKTLTVLAQTVVAEKRRQMPSLFKIRSKRVVKGLSMVRAEKKDWPFPEATVGHRDPFMVLQETGGMKKSLKGRHVAIPSKAVRRTTAGRVIASQKPKAILSRPTGKLAKGRSGQVIRRKPTKRSPLSLMFFLRGEARIKPALGLLKTTEDVVGSQYDKVFGKELGRALKG